METPALQGKTALVTGASKGIGMACAGALAQDGATVVIMARSEQALVRARADLSALAPGARIETFVGDACKEEQLRAALDFAHGLDRRLDILVPTVGGGNMKPLLIRDLESVRQEIDVNFISVFLMVRHGVPLLRRGGTIVCISTVGVNQAFWGLGIYAATKAAMERLVRAGAFELGGAGIRINAVRPGMTAAREEQALREMKGVFERYAAETPLGRVGEPDDIARVVRFLAGPESAWVTGQIFSADGGQEMGRAPDHMDDFFGREVMDQIRAGKPVEITGDHTSTLSSSLKDPDSTTGER